MQSLPSLHEAHRFVLCPTHCLSSPLAQEVCTGRPVVATEGLAHAAASSPAPFHHHQPAREGGDAPPAEPRWSYPRHMLVSDVFRRSSRGTELAQARPHQGTWVTAMSSAKVKGGHMAVNLAVFMEEGFPVEASWVQDLQARSS